MWYVIQTKTGNEYKLKLQIEERLDKCFYSGCYVPVYESVRRREGKARIVIRRIFPGYLFINTDEPIEVHKLLRKLPGFAAVLEANQPEDDVKVFIPIGAQDEAFLDTILEDGIMHVSYVHLGKDHKIDRVAGPLELYRQYITKMEFRHRFATVEADIFGKRRKIHFGLWGDTDPKLPWIEEQKRKLYSAEVEKKESIQETNRNLASQIAPGDKVIYPEIYGETVFEVTKVDISRGIVYTSIEMFGSKVNVELYAWDVRKVGPTE